MIEKENTGEVLGNYTHEIIDLNLERRRMRAGRMVDIHNKYRLFPHTLHLAVWIMEKCISTGKYSHRIDELSIVAMHMAAKYEETYRVPELKDLIRYSGGGLVRETSLHDLEAEIADVMDFAFVYESPHRFL